MYIKVNASDGYAEGAAGRGKPIKVIKCDLVDLLLLCIGRTIACLIIRWRAKTVTKCKYSNRGND